LGLPRLPKKALADLQTIVKATGFDGLIYGKEKKEEKT
jgi:hypothetical protein